MSEDSVNPQDLLEQLIGQATDRAKRLFAVRCCRRVSDLLSDKWKRGIEMAERFAEAQASRDEMVSVLEDLTRDFKEVIESDNGEIYSAKQAVIACLSPQTPFDARGSASAASNSIGCIHDRDDKRREEERWQVKEIRASFGDMLS